MLDFFTIFSKGGLVLWCFQGVSDSCTGPVNALIRSVLLQERGGNNSFTHEALTLKYKLDNQFELVFVVGFQKILTLTYVDKLIDDVHRLFRDKYRTEIQQQSALSLLNGTFDFQNDFLRLLREAEESSKVRVPATMKKYEDSEKAKKPVRSMIETRGEKPKEKAKKKTKGAKKEGLDAPLATSKTVPAEKSVGAENGVELSKEELIRRKREEFIQKHGKGIEKSGKSTKSDAPKEKGKKAPRVWAPGGCVNKEDLDYSAPTTNGAPDVPPPEDINLIRGTGPGGQLQDLDCSSSDDEGAAQSPTKPSATKGTLGGMFGMLKGLVGSKSLSREDMESVLDKMRDHLIAKNVAADIAVQLCESVANKLEGKVMGTFSTVTSTVKQALQESLVQILQPQRRVDMLRDIMDAQRHQRPYVVTFCGVNGVGKSTNLAKISFWLLENGFSVLIAACDTFRAGAVEQLRTHARRLSVLHPPESHGGRTMVHLFERGYGKDAAGIAMEAIAFARNQGFDVVLVDTAGRMQDNAPLMTALAKLITVNTPDLVLFVGEALVGNEAVDQLVKFNRALADHSMAQTPRLIDGIVLTKFDTIDDKVGAAISMTYITSKPIVFVGTGQTYCDLRSLNAKAVVAALMKA
ncbi:LOW QUALITY PROTEIN: signal recognition particle receptor subunit alpha-like [Pteronotus mesoamericanus]|uniref:signal recognition particle receptor subunit alpha n=1 Tax=Pteronotus mesoamericanus TaxID=1884717 RepID=UPI0023EAFB90|nr:signal recognition particle receptor subunit alpha [Pteronotus parnellii mesoamericanus]XP_054448772.1 LOW QUALITY PROTEIN: signal recognition particle receptor subunit alpha-like [Pteronotus parnellii mesoamericanus]